VQTPVCFLVAVCILLGKCVQITDKAIEGLTCFVCQRNFEYYGIHICALL